MLTHVLVFVGVLVACWTLFWLLLAALNCGRDGSGDGTLGAVMVALIWLVVPVSWLRVAIPAATCSWAWWAWELDTSDAYHQRKHTLWRPTAFWRKTWWRLGLGFEKCLLELDGHRYVPPQPIRTLYLALILDPRQWLLWEREHLYYDGPHDSLRVGPFQLSWDFVWCEKCTAETRL